MPAAIRGLHQPRGRFGEVFAFTSTIDDEVLHSAVALAGDFGLATFQQLDIAIEHHCYRLVDAAVALWESSFGLLGDFLHSLTPGLARGIVAVLWVQVSLSQSLDVPLLAITSIPLAPRG